MLGAPVDELLELGAELEDVVIARVEAVRPHPNADRLRLCTVDAGGVPLQVVCGAPNVEGGGFYPFVGVGSTLPGGMAIRKAKLRGEESEGMLCSARELGLGKDHAGLMTLHGEWKPGSSFIDALGLDDTRLVLDITANRSDLLSHLGVARELAPGGVADLRLPPLGDGASPRIETAGTDGSGSEPLIRVTIEDPEDCPRYLAAVIEGIQVGPSPEWLASRLRAIGLRPINNVVDATNYVLHEVGQPLHAFDLDKLAGPEIRVRRALPGERLLTLDGVDRSLAESALVIADPDRAVALAGIMGGELSEVGPSTTRILLECALFDPRRVRATARMHGMSTDASHRFERGVDSVQQPRALRRVIEVILATTDGRVSGPVVDVHPSPAGSMTVDLRPARVKRLLGIDTDFDEIGSLLTPIGFQIEGTADAVRVEVPAYRPDVTREVDVIEEIARRRGYDSFDAELSLFRPGVVPQDELLGFQGSVHDFFARWGFLEARTAAFAPADDARLPILNPLSSEESHLRDDLAHGLLRRVEHNWAHGVRAIRLYEIGTVFRPADNGVAGEEVRVAAVFTGARFPLHWSAPADAFDAWDLKGLMSELSDHLALVVEKASDAAQAGAYLDPSEAFVFREPYGEVIGRGGRVASRRIDAPAWADPLWMMEVRLVPPADSKGVRYQALPEFPAIERDLALVLENSMEAGLVERVIRQKAGSLLEEVGPFDLYAGQGIPDGTRSIAWRLRFRHPERTLTDREVDEVIDIILKSLHEELNVERR